MLKWDRSGDWINSDAPAFCSGGITEAIGAIIASVGSATASAGAGIASAVGLGDAALGGVTAGSAIGGAIEGAGVGALGGAGLAGIEGKPILSGALTGGLEGGAVGGLGPIVGGVTGLGAVGGGALVGAGAGALGSAATGGSALTGALEGGVGGALSGALSPGPATGTAAGSVSGGPGAGAGAISAPPGSDIYAGGAGSGTGDAVLNSGAGLSGPEPSGLQSAVTGYGGDALQGPTATGATLDSGGALSGATSDTEPPTGTSAALQGQASLVPPGTADQATLFGSSDATAPATSPGAGTSIADVNTFPVPPQPPMLNAAGSPALDATGSPVYSTPEQATYQGNYNTAATSNFSNPTVSNSALAGATAAPAGNSIGNLLAHPGLDTLGTALSSNANILLPGALLGYEAIKGNQTPPGLNAISGEANQLNAQSQQLQSYLTSGTLPPGVSTALSQAAKQAEATIRSQYASRGMSGSSAEQADLANVQNTIVSQGASIAQNLLTTGVQEAGLAANLYAQIMQTSLQQDQQLGNAITSLASASVSPRITLSGATTSG